MTALGCAGGCKCGGRCGGQHGLDQLPATGRIVLWVALGAGALYLWRNR